MSARRFKGYRVGIIKPDGARRYMKPRSDGKWSLSETKPMLLDEDEMSDALDDVGDFMVGGDVSFSTPVFATRKPKPAPAEGAAEARYACWQGCCMWLTPEDDDPRDTGTRAEAAAVVARIPGAKLVRVLDDGAHEVALEAAYERGKTDALRNVHALGTVEAERREERERVAALLATEAERLDIGCEEAGVYLRAAEIAKKGQAK